MRITARISVGPARPRACRHRAAPLGRPPAPARPRPSPAGLAHPCRRAGPACPARPPAPASAARPHAAAGAAGLAKARQHHPARGGKALAQALQGVGAHPGHVGQGDQRARHLGWPIRQLPQAIGQGVALAQHRIGAHHTACPQRLAHALRKGIARPRQHPDLVKHLPVGLHHRFEQAAPIGQAGLALVTAEAGGRTGGQHEGDHARLRAKWGGVERGHGPQRSRSADLRPRPVARARSAGAGPSRRTAHWPRPAPPAARPARRRHRAVGRCAGCAPRCAASAPA